MEEVEVGLLEKVIVYHTLKNLPSDYDMIKQVILHERRLPTYLELEAPLLNEEMSTLSTSHDQPEALATSHRNFSRQPYQQRRSSSTAPPYGSSSPVFQHSSSQPQAGSVDRHQ